jgi:hypothetical protein
MLTNQQNAKISNEKGRFSEMDERQNLRQKILPIIFLLGIIGIVRYEFIPSEQ